MNAIAKELNRLADIQLEIEVLKSKEEEDILALLDEETRNKIDRIKKKYSDKTATLVKKAKVLEVWIRKETLEYGETVKGEGITAVFASGRVSWNDDSLMGYAIDHPEITQFRSKSDPYITIRKR